MGGFFFLARTTSITWRGISSPAGVTGERAQAMFAPELRRMPYAKSIQEEELTRPRRKEKPDLRARMQV